MKKTFMILLALGLTLSTVACTKESVLTKPVFTAIFIGSDDPEWSLINSDEAESLLSILAYPTWEKADKDNSVPIDFMAIDESETTYSFGQKNDTVLITIIKKNNSKSTYSVKGTSRTAQIISGILVDMIISATVRKNIQELGMKAGNLGSDFVGDNTTFDLTEAESESLKTTLDINSWTIVKLPETLPETPDAIITISDWKKLVFVLISGNPYVYYIGTNSETNILSLPSEAYESFMTLLGNIRTVKLSGPDPLILDAKITETYFDFLGLPTWDIPNWGIALTAAEKDQLKMELNVDQWVKLTKQVTLEGTSMVLKTDNDLTLTFGHYANLQQGPLFPVVFVTKTSVGTQVGTYYPSGMKMTMWSSLFDRWNPPFPLGIKTFTFNKISVGYNDPSEGDVGISYHDYPVSASQLADLRILMSFSTWELDKDPVKYGFGWLPWLVLNGMTSDKNIYVAKLFDKTVFWVRGVAEGTTSQNSDLFYTCDPAVYDAMVAYAKSNFK